MDFSWSEEQLALKRSVLAFAQKELAEGVVARDRAATFPMEKWRQCAEFGIHGLAVPQEFGGSGLDPLTTILAMETLGYGCRDNGLLFAIQAQMWSVQVPILRFGSTEQKETYLPRLVDGSLIGAHAMTEPESGSDCFALSTRADLRDGGYLLNGTKMFVSNAPVADLFLVFATVNKARGFMGITAFLIEKDTPGLSVGRPMDKMGLKTAPLGEVVLEDCLVPERSRLGKEGNGGAIFNHSMGWERSFILASCVGAMARQMDQCAEYARTRHQFGQPIGAFQSVSNRLVDMKVRLETARLLLYKVGYLRGQGQTGEAESAMAKLYLSECFVQSSLDAIQIHGGYGYMAELEVERDLRDAVGSRIYSGTSELQRQIIARSMGL